MRYRVFTYSAGQSGECADLNAFLASHRVLDVRHHPADDGRRVVFVVEYLENAKVKGEKAPPRVDYREELSEEQFAVFSQLRDLRKKIAEEEGVAVYNVFTNAQLAAIVKLDEVTPASLSKVAGVGKARVEKYGERFLAARRDLKGEAS